MQRKDNQITALESKVKSLSDSTESKDKVNNKLTKQVKKLQEQLDTGLSQAHFQQLKANHQ
jgi:nitrate reductase cytochrome c-type subunit